MYQIKNVVNYEPRALELEFAKELERFHNDKRIPRLLKRGKWFLFSRQAASFLGFACSLSGLVLFILRKPVVLFSVLGLLGLTLSSINLFILSPAVSKAVLKNAKVLADIIDSYGDTPAMKYHGFITRNGCDELEIWGMETKDSKFEVVLSKMIDGQLVKTTFICDFDEQNAEGVLTLDVLNGVVLRAEHATN